MKILRLIVAVAHFGVMAVLLGTLLNAYVPPKISPFFNLLSLAFPVLMIVNVVFILVWIVLRKKRALLFLLLSLFLINPTRRWVNISKNGPEKANFKLVSVNLQAEFLGEKKIEEYMENSGADVIISQEMTGEAIYLGYPYRTKEYSVVALSSKTEILDQGKLEAFGVGNAFFADISIKGKTIRFINVYLSPFSFDKSKVKPTEDIDQNKIKLKYVLKRLLPVFKIHQDEVAAIRKAVESSPYPVILAGDFNAVPNSYEYYHLGKNLKDVFVETGNGSATSFHDYKFPIRIDYVFCSKDLKPLAYKVDRSVKLSDHFPVITEFKID